MKGIILLALILTTNAAPLNVVTEENIPSAPLPATGAAVDEVVVESSLYIKPKPKESARRIRSLAIEEHGRVKHSPQRFGGGFPQQQQQQQYGQSQAAANAQAHNNYQDPFGFGSSQANALSQAFNAQGPSGSFGASSAGTATQALNANKFGVQNSAGASMSQSYTLPNGQTINFASTNSFANNPFGNSANSRGGAVSVSQG